LKFEKEQESKFKGMKGPNKGISPLLYLKKWCVNVFIII
jgi:hypothetical protein